MFESEHEDRALAHSRLDTMETEYRTEIQILTELLEDSEREKEALRGTLRDVKPKLKAQAPQLRYQMGGANKDVDIAELKVRQTPYIYSIA